MSNRQNDDRLSSLQGAGAATGHIERKAKTVKNLGKKVSAGVALTAVSAMTLTGVAGAGHGSGGKQMHEAELEAVPHDPQAAHASNVRGKAHIKMQGNRVKVMVEARGLSPKMPHAMDIHGKEAGELAFCPGAERRDELVNDGLIETVEGLPDYGPVQVSLTTRGDTSPESVLALNRFPVAKHSGKLEYERTFSIPRAVAARLEEKHIVIHGEDLDRDGEYEGRTTKLGAPLEADRFSRPGRTPPCARPRRLTADRG